MPKGIGNIRRIDLKNTLRGLKDSKNFHIDKGGRFGARFFQVLVCFILWFFIGRLGSTLMTGDTINTLWFLAIVSPMGSIFNVLLYVAPWFFKSWNSRRIIIAEFLIDGFLSIMWFSVFIAAAAYVAPTCAPGKVPAPTATIDYPTICSRNNWVVAFAFFELFAWVFALALDISAFYKGVVKQPDVDPEALLEIRRSARGRY